MLAQMDWCVPTAKNFIIPGVPKKYTTLHKRCSTLNRGILTKYVWLHRRKLNLDFDT